MNEVHDSILARFENEEWFKLGQSYLTQLAQMEGVTDAVFDQEEVGVFTYRGRDRYVSFCSRYDRPIKDDDGRIRAELEVTDDDTSTEVWVEVYSPEDLIVELNHMIEVGAEAYLKECKRRVTHS